MASSVQSSRVSPRGYCSCCRVFNMWCWRAFKWLPVLVIVSIVAWSYYAYVVQLCISKIDSTLQQCVYLVIYHVVLIMFIWAYGQTVFASILPIPDKYKLPQTELEKLLSAETEDGQRSILENFAKDLPIVTRLRIIFRKYFWRIFRSTKGKEILETYAHTINVLTRTMSGSVRYCNRCVLIKPDRAHHCSICGTCVLKMDHHCPWVNNCVCYHNYKFFILFLGYALAYCLFVMFTTLPHFIKFWKGDFGAESSDGRYHIVFAFFVSLMFSISLGSLFGYHCYLVANNRTTLDFLSNRKLGSATGQIVNSMLISMVNEAFRAPMFRGGADKNGFSLGAFNNFKEVFGISPGLWLIPVFTSLGDGAEFPVRREHQLQTFTTTQDAHGYESMGITRSSLGDAFVYTVPRQDEESESLLSSEQWERWGERSRPFDERGSSSLDEL